MKHTVTRVRHIVEAIVVNATNSADAIEKAKKTKRADWSHLDSKKRRGYKAVAVSTE